jgi:hypothetical protein
MRGSVMMKMMWKLRMIRRRRRQADGRKQR